MQSLLEQLNTVPGVIGTMVCSGGNVIAQAFPSLFGPPMLTRAARSLADGTPALETVTGTIGLIDLKYGDARVVVKPVSGAQLVFLCSASMNLQPLAMSTSITAPKIEKLLAGTPSSRQAAPSGTGQLFRLVQRINA